jgi:hypothetical protein
MKLFRINDMTRGWFVGNFSPTVHATGDFEVGYREYPANHPPDPHYHPVVTEINLIVHGRMRLHDQILTAGDIFVLDPWEISNAEYLETTGIVCVKYPSMNDKQLIEIKDSQ